jgi:hypothetical protein
VEKSENFGLFRKNLGAPQLPNSHLREQLRELDQERLPRRQVVGEVGGEATPETRSNH